jgi:hypothetical protein
MQKIALTPSLACHRELRRPASIYAPFVAFTLNVFDTTPLGRMFTSNASACTFVFSLTESGPTYLCEDVVGRFPFVV